MGAMFLTSPFNFKRRMHAFNKRFILISIHHGHFRGKTTCGQTSYKLSFVHTYPSLCLRIHLLHPNTTLEISCTLTPPKNRALVHGHQYRADFQPILTGKICIINRLFLHSNDVFFHAYTETIEKSKTYLFPNI